MIFKLSICVISKLLLAQLTYILSKLTYYVILQQLPAIMDEMYGCQLEIPKELLKKESGFSWDFGKSS